MRGDCAVRDSQCDEVGLGFFVQLTQPVERRLPASLTGTWSGTIFTV